MLTASAPLSAASSGEATPPVRVAHSTDSAFPALFAASVRKGGGEVGAGVSDRSADPLPSLTTQASAQEAAIGWLGSLGPPGGSRCYLSGRAPRAACVISSTSALAHLRLGVAVTHAEALQDLWPTRAAASFGCSTSRPARTRRPRWGPSGRGPFPSAAHEPDLQAWAASVWQARQAPPPGRAFLAYLPLGGESVRGPGDAAPSCGPGRRALSQPCALRASPPLWWGSTHRALSGSGGSRAGVRRCASTVCISSRPAPHPTVLEPSSMRRCSVPDGAPA